MAAGAFLPNAIALAWVRVSGTLRPTRFSRRAEETPVSSGRFATDDENDRNGRRRTWRR